MPYFARTRDPSVDSSPPTRRHAVVSVADAKNSAPRLTDGAPRTRRCINAAGSTKLLYIRSGVAVLGTDRHARSRLPRRTIMALAGDNTIGWQDKQDYRAINC